MCNCLGRPSYRKPSAEPIRQELEDPTNLLPDIGLHPLFVDAPKNAAGCGQTFVPLTSEARKLSSSVLSDVVLHFGKSKICKSIHELSSWLNPIIQGWINYYSKFNKTKFRKVMNYLNEKLIRWLRRKFKRFRSGYIGRAKHALTLTAPKNPNLFAHWECRYKLYMKRVN